MKILLVEDDLVAWKNGFERSFRNGIGDDEVELLIARTKQEARDQLTAHSDIEVILMDGDLEYDREKPTRTMDFVKEIRESFSGVIIATSASRGSNEVLMRVGCNDGFCKNELWYRDGKLLLDTIQKNL